jgi:hypothetical protein
MKNVLETSAEPSMIDTVLGAQIGRFLPVDAGST